MYDNMDIPIMVVMALGTFIGFIMGHARGYKIGKREGIVRGRIMARKPVNTNESI